MKNASYFTSFSTLGLGVVITMLVTLVSCKKQFEELPINPNVANENSNVPPSYLFRSLLVQLRLGGGVADNMDGNVPEEPWQYVSRINQYQTGLTFPLYGGSNEANWTITAAPYSMLRDIIKLEQQATSAFGSVNNPYLAVCKFLRAYIFVWYSNRVGDIPMTEAGLGAANFTPKFDTQKEVFENALQLLEEANEDFEKMMASTTTIRLDGDIYFNRNVLRWRKVVNTFKIRVLLSLSKRANDTPDMRIKERFAETLSNPTKFPVAEANADNLAFAWVAQFNRPNVQFRFQYPDQTTIASTFLDITTATEDPRTFIAATPAPKALADGKAFDDFTAYKGTENGRPQGTLNLESQSGMYSYANFLRYNRIDNYPEPYIILGYAELCFNMAEGINRGWAGGDAADWYEKGIRASLQFFGISEGSSIPVGNLTGSQTYGQARAKVNDFLNHPLVRYQSGTQGLEQILKQRYVAMWQNSGWEPFYQNRRTGIPAFSVGPGTNGQQRLPRRWLYPAAEVQNNPNAQTAISRQFSSDNVFEDTWLTKD